MLDMSRRVQCLRLRINYICVQTSKPQNYLETVFIQKIKKNCIVENDEKWVYYHLNIIHTCYARTIGLETVGT